MRIEELHVGDVINFYGRLATLQSVSAGGGYTVIEPGEKDFKICGIGHLTGARITQDILEQMGFTPNRYKYDHIQFVYDHPSGIQISKSANTCILTLTPFSGNINIKYAHELQNLVLFHTNTVLTL